MASQADQLALKVQWSLERLIDGNEESQSQNAHYLAGIPSSQVWTGDRRRRECIARQRFIGHVELVPYDERNQLSTPTKAVCIHVDCTRSISSIVFPRLSYTTPASATQDNAATLRGLGVIPGVVAALKARSWAPGSDVPATLARALNNIFKQCARPCCAAAWERTPRLCICTVSARRVVPGCLHNSVSVLESQSTSGGGGSSLGRDGESALRLHHRGEAAWGQARSGRLPGALAAELFDVAAQADASVGLLVTCNLIVMAHEICRDEASCGQARSGGGPGALAAVLFDVAAQADAEDSLWEAGRINDTAVQAAEALATLVEVHTDSQVHMSWATSTFQGDQEPAASIKPPLRPSRRSRRLWRSASTPRCDAHVQHGCDKIISGWFGTQPHKRHRLAGRWSLSEARESADGLPQGERRIQSSRTQYSRRGGRDGLLGGSGSSCISDTAAQAAEASSDACGGPPRLPGARLIGHQDVTAIQCKENSNFSAASSP